MRNASRRFGLELNHGITLSVQSMDAATLKIIKRRNMKVDSLSGFTHRYKKKGIEAYTEVILGLPGESYQTFADGVDTLLAGGLHDSLYIYPCSVLPNAELNDPIYRRVHEIETLRTPYRPIHTAPEGDPVLEYEDIVISTRTMPRADWKRSNLFAWGVQCFHDRCRRHQRHAGSPKKPSSPLRDPSGNRQANANRRIRTQCKTRRFN